MGKTVMLATEQDARTHAPAAPWAVLVETVRWGGAALLVAACVVFAVSSRHWRVVNDAALMHYVVLLQQHGWVPYREIRDINLPGAYLPDWIAMQLAGTGAPGDLAWRIYDLSLLAVAAAAMVSIAWPADWFAGVLGGALFALFHGRDGAGQSGQRDLAIAVLVLVGCAAMHTALRRRQALPRLFAREATPRSERGRAGFFAAGRSPVEGAYRRLARLDAWFWLSGLALGMAATVKPFVAGFLLLYLAWIAISLRKERRTALLAGASLLAGFAVGPAAAAVYLLRQHAMGSFVEMCRIALPFHQSIARPGSGALLAGGFPPSLVKLGSLAVLAMLLRSSWRSRETQVLLLSIGMGLACFIAQQKGYPYQRYPYIAFLFLWAALELVNAMRDPKPGLRLVGFIGVGYALSCAPAYLRVARHSSWTEPYMEPIKQHLRTVAGPAATAGLNARVQCIDTMSGCVDVLYQLGLEQATGTLYDEFLFPPLSAGRSLPQAVAREQQAFLREFAARPPKVIIVSPWLFTEGPGNYQKLERWPALQQLLADYRLLDQQTYPRTENGPMGFRMYVRR